MRKLHRELVVRQALALVDEMGLEGLTMRRLAEGLGVQNPALYRHFTNKQALLTSMAEMILVDAFADFPNAEAESWDEWLIQLVQRYRGALLSHRDGARLIASANFSTSELLIGIERALQVLQEAGFDPLTALTGIFTLFDYTLGAVFEEQENPNRHVPGRSDAPALQSQFVASRFPTLAATMDCIACAAVSDLAHAGFEAGVRLVLDGLRARQSRGV